MPHRSLVSPARTVLLLLTSSRLADRRICIERMTNSFRRVSTNESGKRARLICATTDPHCRRGSRRGPLYSHSQHVATFSVATRSDLKRVTAGRRICQACATMDSGERLIWPARLIFSGRSPLARSTRKRPLKHEVARDHR